MTEASSTITKRREGDVLILTIQLAEIREYEVSQQLSRDLADAISGESLPRVVVDLSKVQLMTSVAYLPFVGLRSKVLNAEGSLALCNFSDLIKEIFDTARLLVNNRSPSAPFPFADSIEEAIALVTAK